MPIKSRLLSLVLMALALLVSGCATIPQSQSVETVEETRRAIHEPQIATTENEVLAVKETPAINPVEVVLQVQALDFHHEGIGTQRDTQGHLHPLVNVDRLYFIFGKGQLKPKSAIPLRHLANVLIGYPGSRLTISVHTDHIGSEQVNFRLSQEQAHVVRDALLLYGVPCQTIAAAIGYGEARPIADHTTVERRAMNRRVDLCIAIDTVEAAANQMQNAATSATLKQAWTRMSSGRVNRTASCMGSTASARHIQSLDTGSRTGIACWSSGTERVIRGNRDTMVST